jgi:hypothetical protein
LFSADHDEPARKTKGTQLSRGSGAGRTAAQDDKGLTTVRLPAVRCGLLLSHSLEIDANFSL